MHNLITGDEINNMSMEEFPSPDLLWDMYKSDSGGISEEEENVLNVPYHYEVDGKEPRYYQWIAINRALSSIVRGDKRLLLVLATGTGKTLVAFQIIWRLLKAKSVKKKSCFLQIEIF